MRLGVKTTTADAEGDVVQTRPVTCSVGQVVEVLDQFTGPISQVPPMFSALKKDGKALYEYARDGVEVERAARQVTIHELELLDMQLQGDEPYLRLRVACSKGTYIRTLGEDIGEALGCGGHLTFLRRVQTGPFGAASTVTVEALEAMSDDQRMKVIKPVETLLDGYEKLVLDNENAARFLSGMRRRGDWNDAERVMVFGEKPHALLGTAHTKAGELIPVRLLSPAEIGETLTQQELTEID